MSSTFPTREGLIEPEPKRILIVGGYGVFGERVARRLARQAEFALIVAGRNPTRAAAAAAEFASRSKAHVTSVALDAATARPETLTALSPSVVINASGPFQARDYTLAEAAIGAGCHYIDLADARAFVTGIRALDRAAKAASVLVVSGASSVPGLSSAVVAKLAPEFCGLHSIEIGILPGSSFDPGRASAASVLSGAGKPMVAWRDGRKAVTHGWLGLRRRAVAGLGRRWLADVDVPDLALFPEHYPSLEACRFSAGIEIGAVQVVLAAFAWLRRAGLAPPLDRFAGPLLALKRQLAFLGSDTGAMFVRVAGTARDGSPKAAEWTLIARHGVGPFVPALPSVMLAKQLARGELARTGATPCLGLFSLDAFIAEASDLEIECSTADVAVVNCDSPR